MQLSTPKFRRQAFLQFSPPNLTEAEINAVTETLRSGWLTTGAKTQSFERDFAAYSGAESALALSSCTAGLHLSLVTLGIGPGDEVITSPLTFCSSVNVIEHAGATPILVDIDPMTLTVDPERVANAITPRTKAIMPIHYAGHPADMQPILDLAWAHGLHVVEDAAHALPARYGTQTVGTIGDLTAFSFYATKNLTTGEGGMLTGSSKLIEQARVLSLNGMSRDAWKRYGANGSCYYEVVAPGFKYNMTDIQAALGMVQLERLDTMQSQRLEAVAMYQNAFSTLDPLQIPYEHPAHTHAWHLYVLRLNLEQLHIDRAQFIEELTLRNIGSSVHFIPVHMHPYYADKYGWQPDDFPITYREFQRLVSLPLYSGMTEDETTDVIAAVTDIVETYHA